MFRPKRLAKKGLQIKRLYSQKANTAPHPQIEMLIADAALQGLLPVYCFYSAEAARSTWTAASMPPNYQAGCLVGLANAIKAQGSKYFSSIEQVSVPWHFLVCEKLSQKTPFPSIEFLNGRTDTRETPSKAPQPYLVSTESSDRFDADHRYDLRELLGLPMDYHPSPVIGRVSIDCRQLDTHRD